MPFTYISGLLRTLSGFVALFKARFQLSAKRFVLASAFIYINSAPLSALALVNNNVDTAKLIENGRFVWYEVPQKHTVTFTTSYGEVVIALHPALAPKHVARFIALINAEFYDNQAFYRVVDGFVAQAGSNDSHNTNRFEDKLLSSIPSEFTQPLSRNTIAVENRDMFAPQTGFLDGFAVGIDKQRNEMWGLHCPGTVAFARNTEKDTASTEFYIVIGQAPRHLDRNMSVVGRVVQGMDVLQKLPRGRNNLGGVIEHLSENSAITKAYIHPPTHPAYFIQTPLHEEYKKRTTTGKILDNPFFHDKIYSPRPIDVCYYQTKNTTKPW